MPPSSCRSSAASPHAAHRRTKPSSSLASPRKPPHAAARNILYPRSALGNTIVLAAVYGPKSGTKKSENPERASIEVIWKPKTGQIGKQEKEYEMILKKTLQSICLLTIHPNTTASIILQVVSDNGSLLPCAINACCVALADAGIPLKHLAVAICCGLTKSGSLILDPTKAEEQAVIFSEKQVNVLLCFNTQTYRKPNQLHIWLFQIHHFQSFLKTCHRGMMNLLIMGS